jgi:hypothetical protein
MSYNTEEYVDNMMRFLRTRPELIDFLVNFNEDSGFMWSGDPRTIEIGNAVMNDGHSGASMAMCMRECQYLLKKEKENEMVIENLEDEEIPETNDTMAEIPTLQRQSTTTHLNYINETNIDETNKTAIDIAATQGWDTAVEHMLKKDDGTPRTYSEMRSLYG